MREFAGLYEIAEAARYLQATSYKSASTYQAVHRWVRSGLPPPQGQPTPNKSRFLLFEDLISLRMVTVLRQAGFSLQHIRRVHQWLQEVTEYPRPFTIKELWVSQSDIFIEMERQLLSASRRGQYAMDFVKEWLRSLGLPDAPLDMTFKPINGLSVAATWKPQPYVLLDPLIQFGAPCIEGTRIPTRAVWSMVRGGDSPKTVAMDYRLPVEKVEAAIAWESRLAALAA